MASSKLMSSSSSKSRNSDLSRRPSSNSSKLKPKSSPSSSSSSSSSAAAAVAHQTLNTITTNYSNSGNQLGLMTIDSLFRDDDVTFPHSASDAASSLLDAQIALMDTAGMDMNLSNTPPPPRPKTVDEVWQEIVSGGSRQQPKECKEELPDEMMTLEDFLARAGAVEEEDIKDLHLAPQPETDRLNGGGGLSGGLFGFDHIALSPFQSIDKVEGGCFGNGGAFPVVAASGGGGARGRGKRGRAVLEPLDKAVQQRQRRMIKNRESAARSRERKQAYQVELESLAVRLEEENERLLKEKAERTEERLKQLMEHVIPIVEKRRPSRVLRRFRSLEW